MPTAIGTLSQGNATFDLTKQSSRLFYEVKTDDLMAILGEAGVISPEQKLTQESGTSVQLQNILRRDSKGTTGDADFYSTATPYEYGTRTLTINKLTDSYSYPMKGTLTQQIHPADLRADKGRASVEWMKSIIRYSVLNQAGGNTATSITAAWNASTVFTGGDLTKVTGYNSAIAPSATFKGIGNLGTGGVTTDQGVTSSNTLTFQDFQRAREAYSVTTTGFTSFNRIQGKPYDVVAVVGTSGMNQLRNQSSAANTAFNLQQMFYSKMAGGLKEIMLSNFIVDRILFIEVADDYLPRGVNSGSNVEVANTRRAVIMGANALDLAYGKGYTLPNGDITGGFSVMIDEQYKKANGIGYGFIHALYGCKKTQLEGFGANAGVQRDLATYVITHYTAL
jgi:hypothetical protein